MDLELVERVSLVKRSLLRNKDLLTHKSHVVAAILAHFASGSSLKSESGLHKGKSMSGSPATNLLLIEGERLLIDRKGLLNN